MARTWMVASADGTHAAQAENVVSALVAVARSMKGGGTPMMTITIVKRTEGHEIEDESGDIVDIEYGDEESASFTYGEWEAEWFSGDVAAWAAEIILEHGAIDPSASNFHPRVWYTGTYTSVNGKHEETSAFLRDFPEDIERAIFEKVRKLTHA